MTQAKKELDVAVEEAQNDKPDVDVKPEVDGLAEQLEFINSLTEQGFSASLAQKAFKHVGPDPSDGWYIPHLRNYAYVMNDLFLI